MVKTGPSGAFALCSVPPGFYDLIVEIPGEAPFTIPEVGVYAEAVTDLFTIHYCSIPLHFIPAYYAEEDSDGQAALAKEPVGGNWLSNGKIYPSYWINFGPDSEASIGGCFEGPQYVSKIRMYGDTNAWSNFKVLYNSGNNDSGWTEVTGLMVTKYVQPGGLGDKYTNELSFYPVSARCWKVWAASDDADGVISVYEIDAWTADIQVD